MKRKPVLADAAQLGFGDLLAETDTINQAQAFERAHGHLPGTIEGALPFYRALIVRHHAAMSAADIDAVMALRGEAEKLALRLNKGEPGILAGPDAPGCALARLTAAADGAVPLWGQVGSFVIKVSGMRVRIEMDSIFGIGTRYMPWPNFSAHVVDADRPFLSETGYRSFMGLHAALVPGLTPDTFAAEAIAAHVRQSLKGKLRAVRLETRTVRQKSGVRPVMTVFQLRYLPVLEITCRFGA